MLKAGDFHSGVRRCAFTRKYTVRAAEAEVTSVSDNIAYTCNGGVCDNDIFKAGTLTAGVDVKIADTAECCSYSSGGYVNGKLIRTKINTEEKRSPKSKRVEVTIDIS